MNSKFQKPNWNGFTLIPPQMTAVVSCGSLIWKYDTERFSFFIKCQQQAENYLMNTIQSHNVLSQLA